MALLVASVGCTTPAPTPPPTTAPPARWIALGDSYTKGEAARPEESWPAVAAARLAGHGRSVELMANLGRTGWTARDVLEHQVPRLEGEKLDLVTIQVGINDLVQGRTEDEFRADLRTLVAAVVARTGAPGHVVLVTIPDFSVARAAPRFGDPAVLHDDIIRRNAIIADEASRARVGLADIFGRSREAASDGTLLADDGIHPSARGYAAWVPDVLPALEAALEGR